MMLSFAKPWQKQQERRTKDFSRDTEVNRFGKYIKNFFLPKKQN
jgi:hypothetical protein